MAVTVEVDGGYDSVACPICNGALSRDALDWRRHMTTIHSGTGTWAYTKEEGGSEGPADKVPDLIRKPKKCYGCGATFTSNALLVTHLSSAHGAA